MLPKATLVWIAIAAAETVQGILRMRLLNRRIGDHRARQVGVVSGSLLILLIGWFAVPWIGVGSPADAFAVGSWWLVLMLSFDLGLGRFVFRFPWSRLRADFDVRRGGMLGVGMAVLLCTPWIIARLRGLF